MATSSEGGVEQGDPRFLALLQGMADLHRRKAADYGRRGIDPLYNLRASANLGVPPWVGALIRARDKMSRIEAFLQNGELLNESIDDTLVDAAAYFLLAKVLRDETLAQAPAREPAVLDRVLAQMQKECGQ